MLIDPPITALSEKADCRYTLVVETALRARRLVEGEQPLLETRETKPVSIAVDEINRGLISYRRLEADS